MLFHLNPQGDPSVCKAQKGNCPYAKDSPHFSTAKEARAFFESKQRIETDGNAVISHEMRLSEDVESLLNKLYSKNFSPYIVGGSIRDSVISGDEPKDIDIEVFGPKDLDELEKFLKKSGYSVDSVGKSFGVLKVRLRSGEDLDISMPRKDSKVDDGHQGFSVLVDSNLSLKDAAGRRDFTINSMYYDHQRKVIQDPYGGMKDWKNKELKHINEHFQEDPLRVLRAVQFAGRFRMTIAPETLKLSKNMVHELPKLSNERIQVEFEKLLSKGSIPVGMKALKETGWDSALHLGSVTETDAKLASEAQTRAKTLNADASLYAASLLLNRSDNKRELANRLLSGSRRQNTAISLLDLKEPKELSEKSLRKYAREIESSKFTLKDLYILRGNEKMRTQAERFGIFEKADKDFVSGEMILQFTDQRPGAWVGRIIREANTHQDTEGFQSIQEAERWVQERLRRER